MGVMQDIASGNYAKYFEDMTKAFTPEGIADGNAVLGRLFGSKDVSRAIAAQAAQMTGIGQEIYKRMLPAMADTLMGGLFKETSGQIPPMTNPFLNTDMGAVMQGWLQSIGFAPKQQPTPQASIFDNPFTQAMELMFGADAVKREKLAQTNPFLDNPFAKAFQDMMKNFPMAAEPPKEEAKAKPSAGVDMAAYTDMFNAMFDSGLEVQKTYQKNMEAIFDSYLKGQDKPAPKAE